MIRSVPIVKDPLVAAVRLAWSQTRAIPSRFVLATEI